MPPGSMSAVRAVMASSLSGPVIALSVTIFIRSGADPWSARAVNARSDCVTMAGSRLRSATISRSVLAARVAYVAARPLIANDAV